MSTKQERDYIAAARELGLTVVAATHSGANKLRLFVSAPNGATRPFFFSLNGGDWRAVRNNLAELKRFGDENPAPIVGQKLAAALNEAPQKPSLVDCGECLSGCVGKCRKAVRPADVQHVIKPISEPATMTANTAPAPTAEARQRTTLDRKQFHTLTKWVAANVQQGRAVTLVMLAREAAAAIGFHVPESSLKDALDLEEIKLAEPAIRKMNANRDRVQIVARELVRFMRALGTDPVPELIAIAERRGEQ